MKKPLNVMNEIVAKHLTSPPPTDADLYAAEQKQQAREAAARAAQEELDENERLAGAGVPEAKAALLAASAFANSQPVRTHARRARTPKTLSELSPDGSSVPSVDLDRDRKIIPRHLTDKQEEALELMDLAWRKWGRDMMADPHKANRVLARDLGTDSVIYLKNNIWKSADGVDIVNKLLGLSKPKQEEDERYDDFDTKMEQQRVKMRGGK